MLRSTWPSTINLPPNDWQANQTPEDLSQILEPTLIVVGKHEQDISYRVGKEMESYLSKGKIVVVGGSLCGLHWKSFICFAVGWDDTSFRKDPHSGRGSDDRGRMCGSIIKAAGKRKREEIMGLRGKIGQ